MTMIFGFPGYETLTQAIAAHISASEGMVTIRHFPDGESYVRIETPVTGQDVIIVCGLDHPDTKAMALLFFAQTAREMGAVNVGVICPYLGYMRQDKRFHEGEAVTSTIFAQLLSCYFDWLITVDPHLHRHTSMDEIYTLQSMVVHAADTVAAWIKNNISKPILIGPDEESRQWVTDIATKANAPCMVLTKIRRGDNDVEVSIPELEAYRHHTPVLIDDIISTAHTMIETVKHLHQAHMLPAICIGIHAVFAQNAYNDLLHSGVERIITCDTIPHASNGINISQAIASAYLTGRKTLGLD